MSPVRTDRLVRFYLMVSFSMLVFRLVVYAGAKAVNSVVSDARALALTLPEGQTRKALLDLCNETEQYVDELSSLRLMGKVSIITTNVIFSLDLGIPKFLFAD